MAPFSPYHWSMKRFFVSIAVFCAIFLLPLLGVLGQNPSPQGPDDEVPRTTLVPEGQPLPPPAFRVVGLDDRPKLRNSVRLYAMVARQRLAEETTLDWEGTALIVWTDEKVFLEKTGHQPENTAAAASPSKKVIWINEPAWVKVDDSKRQEIMTHECAHLLLGSLPGGRRIPLWMNEGLVMHLAGQWTWDERMKLLGAHAFGTLPDLKNLEKSFPTDDVGKTLAYQMGMHTVATISRAMGDEPGSVRRILSRLASSELGPAFAAQFWEDRERLQWQTAARKQLGSRLHTAVIILSGTSSIFLIMTLLVFVAWWRMKKKNHVRQERWAEEDEPWTESLTEADIQDIYGDKEDRWD